MPCQGPPEPNRTEVNSRIAVTLLKEIGMYKGDIPYYGEVRNLDKHSTQLCLFCQNNDVTKYSLELQIWWRDHQKEDKARLIREHTEIRLEEDKVKALSKLTDYELSLLGLKRR